MAFSSLCYTQIRTNTVNFFMRRRQSELWKTITSVSPTGMKKGRRTTRQPRRDIKNFYRIGSSPMKITYPGLNTDIKGYQPPITIEEQTEEEMEKVAHEMRDRLELQGKPNKRRKKEKVHPLERGFSGGTTIGQKFGSPPPVDALNFDEFQTYCLVLKKHCHMTKVFGRVYSMFALSIIGNGKGVAGYGVGRASMFKANAAIASSIKQASRRLFFVELFENRTIYQDFYAECRHTRLFAQRRPPGFGLVCHARLRKICEVIGIKDIYVKVEGSSHNYRALTHAFVTGLLNQETHQQLAERTQLHVVEFQPNTQFLPTIIASPKTCALKTEDQMTDLEKLNLDDFYGEGRIPFKKGPEKPFYANEPGHLYAEWRKHPFRNMETKMIRLLADGVIPRWTRTNRHNYAIKEQQLVESGAKILPIGIGLSNVVPIEKN